MVLMWWYRVGMKWLGWSSYNAQLIADTIIRAIRKLSTAIL